jgi:hypothetical protein
MVAILPALATGALSAAGGFAASNLLGGLFGGGGSSGGGGGSFDVSGILPESLPFVDQFSWYR